MNPTSSQPAEKPPVAMLVFHLSPGRLGGVEAHTREVVRQLGQLGWKVVLCFSQLPTAQLREYLSLPNVVWEVLPNPDRSTPELKRIVRRYRPAVLHLQFTRLISRTAWIARLHGVRQIVFTDHVSRPEDYTPRPSPIWKRALARVMTYPISSFIGVSEYNCRALGDLGFVPHSRIQRIYNGMDLTRADAMPAFGDAFRRRYGIPLDRILVSQVSWLIPQKGIPDVLQAARLALDEFPNLHFAFVGEGSHHAEYAKLAAELGVSAHVTWTGVVRDPIGEGVFAAPDICCQASRWQEAFGLAISEAMAFAKPVVATKVGGIPEVICDGETGFLVPPRDPAALAARFVQLARDRELRKRMGEAGRRRAQIQFDLQTNVATLLGYYGVAENDLVLPQELHATATGGTHK